MSYGKLYDDFWDEDDKTADPERLSDDAALMVAFLFSGKHRNAIGCFKLGLGAVTDIPRFQKWGIDRVSKAIREAIDTGIILRDERSGWTLLLNLLKRDAIVGPKVAVHAAKLAHSVPANSFVYRALKERLEPQISEHSEALSKAKLWPMREPIDTPSIPYAIPSRFPEPEPEPEPEPVALLAREPETKPPASQIVPFAAPQEKSEALKIIEAFDAERVNAFGAERARPWPNALDVTEAQRWIAAGATVDLCRPIFAATMTRMAFTGKQPPDTLSYFEKPIANALAEANRPLPAGVTDAELVTSLPAHLDARRKRPASSFDAAVEAARGLVAGG